jgi:hypothetical protein
MPDDVWQRIERLITQRRTLAAAPTSAQSSPPAGHDVAAERRRRAALKPDEVRVVLEVLRKRPT